MQKNIKRKGFTLIEILLAIVMIGILASIIIVAINPNRQINQAKTKSSKDKIKPS